MKASVGNAIGQTIFIDVGICGNSQWHRVAKMEMPNTLFNKAIDLARCDSVSDGTSVKHYKHVLRVGLALKSRNLMKIGLALLTRQTVDLQPETYGNAFTLNHLYERLMSLSTS
jgi:hypothetical protein